MAEDTLKEEFDIDSVESYKKHIQRVGGAIEALQKSEGWQILMKLYEQRKQEIKDKEDYATLEDFRADRRALEIVEGILVELDDFVSDAMESTVGISDEELPKERGIMLIEGQDDTNREA